MKPTTREAISAADPTTRRRLRDDEAYHFVECGLNDVYLYGIEVETDPDSGTEFPIIPRLHELLTVIALHRLYSDKKWTGNDLLYVRRQFMVSRGDLAAAIGISENQLAGEESKKQRLKGELVTAAKSAVIELLARVIGTRPPAPAIQGKAADAPPAPTMKKPRAVSEFAYTVSDDRGMRVKLRRKKGAATRASRGLPTSP